jgi:hypothetical protein
MATDFLEKLADLEIPAVPDQFDRQLHQRMNRSLVMQQLLDLALSGLPWVALHFAQTLLAAMLFTITGRYPEDKKTL